MGRPSNPLFSMLSAYSKDGVHIKANIWILEGDFVNGVYLHHQGKHQGNDLHYVVTLNWPISDISKAFSSRNSHISDIKHLTNKSMVAAFLLD